MGVLREDKSSEGRWGPVQGLQWSPSPSTNPRGTSTNLQTFPLSQAIIQRAQSLIFSSCLCLELTVFAPMQSLEGGFLVRLVQLVLWTEPQWHNKCWWRTAWVPVMSSRARHSWDSTAFLLSLCLGAFSHHPRSKQDGISVCSKVTNWLPQAKLSLQSWSFFFFFFFPHLEKKII